jgi:hypothetical protein
MEQLTLCGALGRPRWMVTSLRLLGAGRQNPAYRSHSRVRAPPETGGPSPFSSTCARCLPPHMASAPPVAPRRTSPGRVGATRACLRPFHSVALSLARGLSGFIQPVPASLAVLPGARDLASFAYDPLSGDLEFSSRGRSRGKKTRFRGNFRELSPLSETARSAATRLDLRISAAVSPDHLGEKRMIYVGPSWHNASRSDRRA